ncbi:hypothetical protein D3C83_173900 [compost metagenome]
MGDRVRLSLGVERLGSRSLTLQVRCDGADGTVDDQRIAMRQVLVLTSLESHRAIELPADLRAAVERFMN